MTDHEPASSALPEDTLSSLLSTSLAGVPEEIRDDWGRYLDRTIRDLWGRRTLAPRDRSLVTIAALTTMGARSELDGHVRLALHLGLSRLELCEAMLQVSGYAGVGRGVEGLRVLGEVFEAEPDLGTDPGDLPTGVEGDDRLARARPIQTLMSPDHVEAIFERLEPYPVDRAPEDRPPFLAGGPEWLGWLTETAFGDLWSRPNLTLRQRELVTSSVLIVLGRNAELRGHFGVALRLDISPEEMSEAIVQLAAYAGFPTAVGAMMLFAEVLAERDGVS